MSSRSSYKANVEMALITSSGEEVQIPFYYITSIITDYDYENNFMPVIYVQLNVDLILYDQLISESVDGKIYLNIKKYDARSSMGIDRDDIRDQFIYFVPTDSNYSKEANFGGFDKAVNTRYLLMGLLKIELMNLNKTSFNGTFLETDTQNMMKLFLENIEDLVMNEIEINTEYEKLIVPPQNSRTNAIKFLFNENPFYTTKYNLFYDYTTTYLTNRDGKPIQESGMNTLLFRVNQVTETSAYVDGMYKDTGSGTYIIDTNVSNTNIAVNNATEKDINQLVGADTDSVSIMDLYINPSANSDNKQYFIRSEEVETGVTKNLLDNTSVVATIAKQNLDGSIVTPDKAYLMKYYGDYSKYDGRFLLIRKKEIINRDDESFSTLLQIELRRISDQ